MTEEVIGECVTDDIQRMVEQAVLIRGFIVTSYAAVEMLLGDLIVRCGQYPEYAGMCDLPGKLNRRASKAKALFTAPGPLQPYRDQSVALIDRLQDFEDLRHLMAHSHATIVVTPDHTAHQLKFQRWDISKGGEPHRQVELTTIEEMRGRQREVGLFSNEFTMLWRMIYADLGLEDYQTGAPTAPVANDN